MAVRPARSVRLSDEDIARIDAQAKSRGISQQVVMESAVKAWLDQAETGQVPVIVKTAKVAPAARPDSAARAEFAANMAKRQGDLNAAKERASR